MERKKETNRDDALTLREHLQPTYAPQVFYDAEIDAEGSKRLRDYWHSIRRHLWFIIGISLLTTTTVAVYIAFQPDIYEASAQVQVNLEQVNPVIGSFGNNSTVVSPTNDPVYFNTQLQILNSPSLLRRVVRTLDLERDQLFLKNRSDWMAPVWKRLRHEIGLQTRDDSNSPMLGKEVFDESESGSKSRIDMGEATRLAPYVESIRSSLDVKPVKETSEIVKDTRLININYRHTSPLIASNIVNAIANTFVVSNQEKKNKAIKRNGDILEKRIGELQTQIRKSEEGLMEYAREHQILSLDAAQNTVVERLTGLNRQLLEAENELKLAEAAYKAALEPGAADALAEDAQRDISQAEVKLAEMLRQREQLLIENTEEWPEVKEVDKQIAVMQEQIKEAREHSTAVLLTKLRTRYRQAATREQSLRAAFEQQRGQTLAQNEAAISYRIMQQEIDTNKNLLEGLMQRGKEKYAALSSTANNIQVTDYSIIPQSPVAPRRVLVTVVAFITSLGLSISFALFLNYIDDKVRSTDAVKKTLNLPTLATIPVIGRKTRPLLLVPSSDEPQGRNWSQGIASVFSRNRNALFPLTEAYRQLRTSILLSPGVEVPRSLLVTSSLAGEGKSTTAINIAASLALTGADVLLIDADIRHPRLHSIFDLSNSRGLSNILSSKLGAAESMSMVKRHETNGLHLLTAGPRELNSPELLGSETMRRLITDFQSTFKYIVIDSPPVAYFTDGVLLSSMVDGVLLVVNSGKSSREIVQRSQQLLDTAGANIYGVVLNKVHVFSNEIEYYYHQTA